MNYYHVLIKHSCKYLCPLNLFEILRVHNGETKWSFKDYVPANLISWATWNQL